VSNFNIAMIGCGRLGMPCAEMLATRHKVTGFDPSGVTSSAFEMAETVEDAAKDADFILVAVPTPHDPAYGGETPTSQLPPRDFNYSILEDTLGKLAHTINPNQSVVVISTVLPGFLRSAVTKFSEMNVIYNPYLIAIGTVKEDMLDPDLTIVGTKDGAKSDSTKDLLAMYQSIGVDTSNLFLGTWEEAESVKVFYNTFISLKIAFANMILDVSEEIGNMNVDSITEALSRCKKRIISPKYLVAGMGDGGACHPRDNIALSYLADRLGLGYDLFGQVSTARERQAKRLAIRLIKLAESRNLPIVILGRSYKPSVPFDDGSYSLLVGHYIEEAGLYVEYEDFLTGHSRSSDGPAVFLKAHSLKVTYGSDTEFDLGASIPHGSVVVDPWREVTLPGIDTVHYGASRSRSLGG